MQKTSPTFNNITIDETVEKIQNWFCILRKTLYSSDGYIGFTFGNDATVVLKSWQPLEVYWSIVGGSYPNHFLGVTKISHDESVNLMK